MVIQKCFFVSRSSRLSNPIYFHSQEDISAVFHKADKDKSGKLSVKEFQEVLDDICERYPQVKQYLKNNKMRNLVDLLKDSKGDAVNKSIEVNLEELKSAIVQMDSQMKVLPATAQVFFSRPYTASGLQFFCFRII